MARQLCFPTSSCNKTVALVQSVLAVLEHNHSVYKSLPVQMLKVEMSKLPPTQANKLSDKVNEQVILSYKIVLKMFLLNLIFCISLTECHKRETSNYSPSPTYSVSSLTSRPVTIHHQIGVRT
ncbi:hypothetical protein J6590_028773 [Homalodisca vitripennis]|nr:hypothetical protein J6590_028773 [Homalodisca vitripennis]